VVVFTMLLTKTILLEPA